jgi:hypothetical protein
LNSLRATLSEQGRRYTAVLPTRWSADANVHARRMLLAAEKAMRGLRSIREEEQVTSGPGSFGSTEYRLVAPDRMAYRTDRGVQSIIAGKRQWLRTVPEPWQASEYGSGLPFRTRSWFRWSTYGRSLRLLGVERHGRERVAQLALFDEGTPVWFRVRVDLATHRVLGDVMTTDGHFMTARYYAANRPLTISLPDTRRGG